MLLTVRDLTEDGIFTTRSQKCKILFLRTIVTRSLYLRIFCQSMNVNCQCLSSVHVILRKVCYSITNGQDTIIYQLASLKLTHTHNKHLLLYLLLDRNLGCSACCRSNILQTIQKNLSKEQSKSITGEKNSQ